MNLKDFLKKDKDNQKLYWALVIEEGLIQAGIWEVVDGKAEVVSISPITVWEVEEDIVSSADAALSSAISNLPEGTGEPNDVVFGIPTSWTKDGQIDESHIGKIKKICSELSLNPSGFVVLPEAVSHFVKSQEGSAFNGVILGLGRENIEITVFKLGNLSGSTVVTRSVSLFDDVVEGLSRFSAIDSLPSRFVVYDGKEADLEDARQSLTSADWEGLEKVRFLHPPKVEVMISDKKVLAVALAGALEMGGVSVVTSKEDSLTNEADIDSSHSNVSEPTANVTPEDLGFVVGADVERQVEEKPIQRAAVVETRLKAPLVERIKAKLPKLSFPKFSSPKVNIKVWLIVIVIALIAGILLWWFVPSASVVIYVSPKKFEETSATIVDPSGGSVDALGGVIPGKSVSETFSGEKTKSTSGTKTVGDRAKGSIKIQNGTAVNVTLPSGTVIVSASNLGFTLDNSASISAKLSPTTPGTATVDVTASKIGAEYNLAKDETFKVANYPKSEVDGLSLNDFTGGTSREITAVSSKDQESLEEELTQELLEKAESKFKSDAGPTAELVVESLVVKVVEREFSSAVGDEASSLKLSLELEITGIVVNRSDLEKFAVEKIKDKVPSGYVLRESQIEFAFDNFVDEEGELSFDLSTKANFLPVVDPIDIAKQIAGKYPARAEEYFTKVAGFSRAEMKIKPRLPGGLRTLPHVASKIAVEVAAER